MINEYDVEIDPANILWYCMKADGDWKWSDPYHYVPPRDLMAFPFLEGTIEKISFEFDWKDQGWGNRKGKLYANLVRDSQIISTLDICPHVADHTWRKENFEYETEELIQLSLPGDQITITGIAGGGGGHSLHVKNFKMGLHFTPILLK